MLKYLTYLTLHILNTFDDLDFRAILDFLTYLTNLFT